MEIDEHHSSDAIFLDLEKVFVCVQTQPSSPKTKDIG